MVHELVFFTAVTGKVPSVEKHVVEVPNVLIVEEGARVLRVLGESGGDTGDRHSHERRLLCGLNKIMCRKVLAA